MLRSLCGVFSLAGMPNKRQRCESGTKSQLQMSHGGRRLWTKIGEGVLSIHLQINHLHGQTILYSGKFQPRTQPRHWQIPHPLARASHHGGISTWHFRRPCPPAEHGAAVPPRRSSRRPGRLLESRKRMMCWAQNTKSGATQKKNVMWSNLPFHQFLRLRSRILIFSQEILLEMLPGKLQCLWLWSAPRMRTVLE